MHPESELVDGLERRPEPSATAISPNNPSMISPAYDTTVRAAADCENCESSQVGLQELSLLLEHANHDY